MTFIIAEAGVNHGGDIGQAFLLVNAAQDAGADAVKFQHFNSRELWGDDRIEALEFDDFEIANLAWHCQAIGIEFMCTPFGAREAAFLAPLVKRMKVASGCLAKPDLLHAVRDTMLPVILSTGMSDIWQINEALGALGYLDPWRYKQPYTLLHCTSAYPCPVAEVNLAAMGTLRQHHGERCRIGYSDHTAGVVVPLAAVAMGATVIEKHLTLDRQASGPDHKASIEPRDFKVMVAAIREIEQAIGDGRKEPQPSEAATREAWYGLPR